MHVCVVSHARTRLTGTVEHPQRQSIQKKKRKPNAQQLITTCFDFRDEVVDTSKNTDSRQRTPSSSTIAEDEDEQNGNERRAPPSGRKSADRRSSHRADDRPLRRLFRFRQRGVTSLVATLRHVQNDVRVAVS